MAGTTLTTTPIPPTMHAWQFSSARGGLENHLELNPAVALPPHDARALGKDKVLVQVFAAALNPVDYKVAEIPIVGRLAIKTPSSPGLDFAGRVVAAGGGEEAAKEGAVRVGDMVFGSLLWPTRFGTLAEYTVARRAGLAVIPQGVNPRDAAGVATAGLTAYQCIIPHVTRGGRERVFINGGSGGTGTFGIQIAKAVGCYVATTCSGRNVELCKSLGADEVIDYTKEDVVEALKRSAQQGGPFDLVVDNVGTDGRLYWKCHQFTSPRAKYVQVGAPIALHSVWQIAMKFLWPGFLGGGKRKLQLPQVSSHPEQLGEMARWMKEGKVKAVVEEVFPMDDARKAFERLKTGRTRGKNVVAVSDER